LKVDIDGEPVLLLEKRPFVLSLSFLMLAVLAMLEHEGGK